MKKTFHKTTIAAAALLALTAFTACQNDEPAPEPGASEQELMLKSVIGQVVAGTINPTYKALADYTEQLHAAVADMRQAAKGKSVTEAQVARACDLFKKARAEYEKSEAFLLGAAAKFNVDPHIDSWPLDVNSVITLLQSPEMVAALDAGNGDEVAYGSLGQNTLGFHGLEFILFRDGKPRPAAQLNGRDNWPGLEGITGEQELIYAQAVAGDLRNNCYQMEIAWNEASNDAHREKLDALEWQYTTNGEISYGQDLATAGQPGSSYTTVKRAVAALVVGDLGCVGICDEVADTKIGKPHNGSTDEDINYIESPYSHNSITDFHDNVVSIQNVWNGTADGTAHQNSLAAYFAKYHKELGQQVEAAIEKAKAEINKMPAPFVKNYRDPQCGAAIEALHALSAKLEEANAAVQND